MQTILYPNHVALGAKIVDFCGWQMPLSYQGQIEEHLHVRKKVGIFDVSHMGRIVVRGNDAEPFLDFLSTNQIIGKDPFSATYTVFCDENGGSVDDLIVYKESLKMFFVIVNAANREKDFAHLKKYASDFDVEVTHQFDKEGMIAIQGPLALSKVAVIFPEVAKCLPMCFLRQSYQGESLIVSRTGYTGEKGVEIYASHRAIQSLWETFLGMEDILPIGLAARDTLRLEMGYALYGHELSDAISPSESVSLWTVKKEAREFLGQSALKYNRKTYPLVLLGKGIAREGYAVLKEGKIVGKITSGTFSPSLNQAIALMIGDIGFVVGDTLDVQIRGNLVQAKIGTLPFITMGEKR